MASNLSKRLDKLEKGIQQFLEAQNPTGPIYLNRGEAIPEGRKQSGSSCGEASHQELEDTQSLNASNSAPRKHPSTLPPLESPAERQKRWQNHLQSIDRRGERWQGKEVPRSRRLGII